MHALSFEDGDAPPGYIIAEWLSLVNTRFYPKTRQQKGKFSEATAMDDVALDGVKSAPGGAGKPAIAVHCVAGLGRAPVLVAVALIEHGMSPLDAVAYIREKRRGAINSRQLKFLESYKRGHSFSSTKPRSCLIL